MAEKENQIKLGVLIHSDDYHESENLDDGNTKEFEAEPVFDSSGKRVGVKISSKEVTNSDASEEEEKDDNKKR